MSTEPASLLGGVSVSIVTAHAILDAGTILAKCRKVLNTRAEKESAAANMGQTGGHARVKSTTSKARRAEIARLGAKARWKKE